MKKTGIIITAALSICLTACGTDISSIPDTVTTMETILTTTSEAAASTSSAAATSEAAAQTTTVQSTAAQTTTSQTTTAQTTATVQTTTAAQTTVTETTAAAEKIDVSCFVGTWYAQYVTDDNTLEYTMEGKVTVSEDAAFVLTSPDGSEKKGTIRYQYAVQPDGSKTKHYVFYFDDNSEWWWFYVPNDQHQQIMNAYTDTGCRLVFDDGTPLEEMELPNAYGYTHLKEAVGTFNVNSIEGPWECSNGDLIQFSDCTDTEGHFACQCSQGTVEGVVYLERDVNPNTGETRYYFSLYTKTSIFKQFKLEDSTREITELVETTTGDVFTRA